MPQTSQLSKECIYTALLQLMSTKPYGEISITDITKRAGVSRMAYYRHYENKDDILLQRLDEVMSTFKEKVYMDDTITEKNFWAYYLEASHNEPLILALLNANLLEQMSAYHIKMTYEIFEHKFGWDMAKERNQMTIYSRIGCIVGLIRYCADYKGIYDKEFAEYLLNTREYYI